MSEKPQRPFVPHRTPDETRAHTGPVEFRIAPPFVHKETRTSGSDATPAVQRAVVVTADGAAVDWPALGLVLLIHTVLDACAIVVDPGPGETLPLDVTRRGEDRT